MSFEFWWHRESSCFESERTCYLLRTGMNFELWCRRESSYLAHKSTRGYLASNRSHFASKLHAVHRTGTTLRSKVLQFTHRCSKYLLFTALQPNPLFELTFEITIRNHIPLALHPDATYPALPSTVHEYAWVHTNI